MSNPKPFQWRPQAGVLSSESVGTASWDPRVLDSLRALGAGRGADYWDTVRRPPDSNKQVNKQTPALPAPPVRCTTALKLSHYFYENDSYCDYSRHLLKLLPQCLLGLLTTTSLTTRDILRPPMTFLATDRDILSDFLHRLQYLLATSVATCEISNHSRHV